MAFDYPNGTYTIAALPIIGILLVIGWFGVRKRVAEIHSTAPVVEEDEENRKLCLSLKRRVNCKIARLRAGQIQTTDEGAGCGVIKVRQFFPFSPRHIYYSAIRITSSGWVASCCLVDFVSH